MARILVVDDDPIIHRLVRSWLVASGHDVDHAEHSREAEDLLGFKTHTYDLIVCDNNMRRPGEGFDLGVTLYLEGSTIPFILHTSSHLNELNEARLTKYHIAYVHKSTAPDALLSKVRELIGGMQNAAP